MQYNIVDLLSYTFVNVVLLLHHFYRSIHSVSLELFQDGKQVDRIFEGIQKIYMQIVMHMQREAQFLHVKEILPSDLGKYRNSMEKKFVDPLRTSRTSSRFYRGGCVWVVDFFFPFFDWKLFWTSFKTRHFTFDEISISRCFQIIRNLMIPNSWINF